MISVLYVDDERDLLEVAQLFLEESGEFKVTISTSAKDALDSVPLPSYDVIISDYEMPGMNGIAFLRAVRERFGDVPFVLFTGRGREEVVIDAINNGADFYLQKGGDPEAQFAELAHKIKQAVGRRRAEHQRTESEKRLLDIINFLPDATFAIDRTGTVIAWNRAMEEMTGLSAGEMLGKGDHEYAIPFYGMRQPILIDLVFSPQDKVRQNYSFVRADKEILTAETTNATPKGKLCVLWGRAAPLYNNQGTVVGAIESIRDITGRKKAEEALQESERTLRMNEERLVMAQAIGHTGSWEYDLETNKIWGSAEGLRIFGFPAVAGDFPLADIEACIPEREHVHQGLVDLIASGKEYNLEFAINPADGSASKMIHSVAHLEKDAGGKPLRAIGVIQDITGRRRTEDALRQSEAKFRGMAERISDIVLLVDKNLFLTYVSPTLLAMTGKAPSDLLGKPLPISNLSSTEQEKIHAAFLENKALKTTGPVEISFPAPEGGSRILEFHGVPIQEGGVFQGVQLVAHDITGIRRAQDKLRSAYEQLAASEEELRQNYDELHKHEQVLRASEEKFRALVEHSLDGILITDFTGTLLFANRAAGLIVDVPDPEAMIGKTNVREFVATEYQADVLQDFRKIAQGIDTYLVNYKLITKKQREIWVECIGKKIPFGETEAVLVSMRDVTERKQAEERVRESESKFAMVFRNSPVALTLVSAADGTFIDVNDAFLRNTGYSRDEVVGSMAVALGIFADRSEYKRFTTFLRNQRTVHGMEMKCRIKTGEIRTCRFSSGIIMMRGRPHILSSVEDITERSAAEAAFQTIIRSMVGTTGINSLHKIAETISSWLGAECVMIGEIQPDKQTVKVLSMLLDGKYVADFTYTLRGTPCENVEKGRFCHYPDHAVKLFPDAKDIVDLNIRGYVGTPLRNSGGQVFGILCALSRNPIRSSPSLQKIMDIIAVKAAAEIERTQIEHTLDKSRRMLGEAMDMAHLVNWEFDVPTGIFTFDDRFYALYGTTAEREGGNLMPAEVYAREFVHPDDRHMVGEEVARAIATTDPYYTARLEHRIVRRDGTIRHIVVRIEITKDAEGRTIKTHGANQDITDISIAEEAVRESEGRFRSLVETSPGIIWEIDPWGRFRYVSPIAKAIMGYEPDELIGKSIEDLILEQFQPLAMQTLTSFVSSPEGLIQPFEIITRHRDGHDLVMEIRPSRITGIDGKLIGFRGVAFDTTERKKAEEALRRANRQLNLLGSITRHDLLNKITVILANLKIAERRCTDPDQGEPLKKIRYATSAIKSQIEFTRIYQDLGTHEPQWIDLGTVMPCPHVPPTVRLDAAVQGIQVLADPMLERVFFNLIDNSVRHGQRVTEIHVSSHQSGGDLVVLWEDNGTGIAGEEKERIFLRGYGKNTGLGLALSREILDITGITISETGEPGKGARFEIVVPKGAYRIAAEKIPAPDKPE